MKFLLPLISSYTSLLKDKELDYKVEIKHFHRAT